MLDKAGFELAGQVLPQGTVIMGEHRQLIYNRFAAEQGWEADWDQFRPERYLTLVAEHGPSLADIALPRSFRGIGGPPAQWRSGVEVAFGGGARMCPGRDLVLVELPSVVAALLRRFKAVRLADGCEPRERASLTVQPRGLKLVFTEA